MQITTVSIARLVVWHQLFTELGETYLAGAGLLPLLDLTLGVTGHTLSRSSSKLSPLPAFRAKSHFQQTADNNDLGQLHQSKHYSLKTNRVETPIPIISYFMKTDPVRNVQSGTQVPRLLYFLQDTHWFGPGPQQPSEEQRGSHTCPSFTTHIMDQKLLCHHQH